MLDVSKAKKELQHILDAREYRAYYDESKSIFETWWEDAKKWIADQLSSLFPSFEPSGSASSFLLIGLIVIMIALLALTVFLMARNMKRNRILRHKNPLQTIKELNWSFQRHLMEAKEQEVIGNYKTATRHLFLALLLYFHEKEWLEARMWKTNWDYYDELGKVNSEWAQQFSKLASIFDEVTYGEREINQNEYIQFHNEAMYWLLETADGFEGQGGRQTC
ncbi:DUF4129 domain-containing protein [Cytobacillus depressus]|uniref:DUF4129 domain-containing protein n=1 Tax=Cytobacillus depressus TaxID=1602942 RepID=A0A6L3V607_9BACI|nr:DUF4129 domain-containing protein [Cytobacillus depressus]KAB2330159.1 DUF4129 domain-containing protein [Cytobacillus depressus]